MKNFTRFWQAISTKQILLYMLLRIISRPLVLLSKSMKLIRDHIFFYFETFWY